MESFCTLMQMSRQLFRMLAAAEAVSLASQVAHCNVCLHLMSSVGGKQGATRAVCMLPSSELHGTHGFAE